MHIIHELSNKVNVQLATMLRTYNVKVRWKGSARVSAHPRRAASLHVNDGGSQAVDIRLGVMSSTQDQLWAHIHLNKGGTTHDELLCRG